MADPIADDEFQRRLNEIDAQVGVNPAGGTPQAMRLGAPPSIPISQMVANINAGQSAPPMQVSEPGIGAGLEPMQETGAAAFQAPQQTQAPMGAPAMPTIGGPNLGGIRALQGQVKANTGALTSAISAADNEMTAQYNAQETAIAQGTDAAIAEAAATTAYNKTKADLAAQQAQKDAADQKVLVDKQADIQNQIDKTTSDYKNAKVDPTRYWANMSTPSKILAGIAMAMGAIGGALTGRGGNPAIDIITKAVEDDVKQQGDQIERARQSGIDLRTQLGDYERITGNKQAANKLVIAQRLEEAAGKMEAEIGKTKDPALRAQMAQQVAAVRAEAAKRKQESAGLLSDAMRQGTGQQIQLEGMKQNAEQANQAAQAAVLSEQIKAGDATDYTAPNAQINGAVFDRKLNEKQLEKAREAVDANNILNGAIERVLAKRQQMGSTFDVKGLLDQEGAYLSNAVKQQLIKAGAAESEAESRTKTILQGFEDASDWGAVEAKVKNLRGIARTASESSLQSFGGKLTGGPAPQFGTDR